MVSSPWFAKTTVTLGSGAQLTIVGNGASPDAAYVQSLKLAGQPVTRGYVTWDELANGGTLELEVGATPNPAWGTAKADRPPAP